MSYLHMEGISKGFGSSTILDGVDLSVRQGELITLLGPSGCGKSTLLRCISGLLEADRGEMILGGRSLSGVAPKDRGIGMVFQSYALFPNMNVEQNIAFGLVMQRMPKGALRNRVDEMLRIIGLEDKRRAYPHELSGGQQQRVALARSLAVEPQLMLMDEPLSALDAKIRRSLRMEFRRIQRSLGMTTIFVTHDQEEALTISDRICVMDRGRIVQTGTPEQIYTNPRSVFVARFIGSYNVLSAQELGQFGFSEGHRDAHYAIRPESISLLPIPEGKTAAQSDTGVLEREGTIEELMILGNVLRFTVKTGGVTLTIDTLNYEIRPWQAAGSRVMVQIPVRECRRLEDAV